MNPLGVLNQNLVIPVRRMRRKMSLLLKINMKVRSPDKVWDPSLNVTTHWKDTWPLIFWFHTPFLWFFSLQVHLWWLLHILPFGNTFHTLLMCHRTSVHCGEFWNVFEPNPIQLSCAVAALSIGNHRGLLKVIFILLPWGCISARKLENSPLTFYAA